MIYLRQSTASQEIPLGYFVDSTDGNTEETALTIANTDIKLWKTGATTLANKNSGGATHISNGIYYAVLDATDTDTIGPMVVFVHVAGALTTRLECCVLDEAVFDVLFGTTALATATNITAAAGCAVSSIGNDVITAASIAAGAIDAATFAADVDAEILSYIVDDATRVDASALNTLSSHDPGATIGTSTLTQTQVTGGAYALNSASFAFNAALDLTTAQAASVNAQADTALADYDGPTYTELLNLIRLALRKDAALATDLSALITTVNADLGSGGGAFANTTDSQEGIRDRGDAAWITATSVTVSDKTGFKLSSDGLALVVAWTVDITGNITGNLTGTIGGFTATALKRFFDTDSTSTYAAAVAGSVVKEIADNAGGASLTVQDIVDGVWDELNSSHLGAGSFGYQIQTIVDGTLTPNTGTVTDAAATATSFKTNAAQADHYWRDNLLLFTDGNLAGQSRPIDDFANTNGVFTFTEGFTSAPTNGSNFKILPSHVHPTAQIADAIWDEATAGHVSAGTFGKAMADILTVTGSFTFTVAGFADVNIQYVNDVEVNGTGAPGNEWGP